MIRGVKIDKDMVINSYPIDINERSSNIPPHRNPIPCPPRKIVEKRIKEIVNKILNVNDMEKVKLVTKKFNCINPIMIDYPKIEYIVEATDIKFEDKYFIFLNDREVVAIVPDSFLVIEIK